MITVSMEMPEAMVEYANPTDEEGVLVRNAMMLYPYI